MAQTKALLAAEGLTAEVIRDSHANMERYAAAETVDCVVFNFGRASRRGPVYLYPVGYLRSGVGGGSAAAEARRRHRHCLYYGGANGYGERDAVMTWLETLDDRKFSVLRCDWANRRNDPPVPIFIWKD